VTRRVASFVILAALAGYGIHVLAQVRAERGQAVTPIASSSSNGISFVWFYDPAERTVYVCRTAQADTVDCKAKSALP
jgi:hypothetical protein